MSLKELKVKFINWLFKGILSVDETNNNININSTAILNAQRISAGMIYCFDVNSNKDYTDTESVDIYIEDMLQQNDLIYQRN